jgi:internalin A
MANERVMQLIREARDKNLTKLDLSENTLTQLPPEIGELKNLTNLILSYNQLTQLPPEIGELKNLTTLNLIENQLTQLPPEIGKLENLTVLNLSWNQLTQLPPEIGQLKSLKELNLYRNNLTQLSAEIGELENLIEINLSMNQLTQLPAEIGELENLAEINLSLNQLTQLPAEIGELKNLKTFDLTRNQLTQLPAEIGELEKLTEINLSLNQLTQLPAEIGELKNLTALNISRNQLTQLPPAIGKLKNLKELILYSNHFEELPSEIGKLKNLETLELVYNKLTQLPPEIGKLVNLTELNLIENQLTQLPPEIGGLKNLKTLYLARNQLTQLPFEIGELANLRSISLSGNPLTSPPPEIVSRGTEAIFTYLKNSKSTENNEAKLILVGNGDVGKTCLAQRLIYNTFPEEAEATKGINISKWILSAPDSRHSEIKLNVWDFGGQEIYHATHQFFLTTRSVYLLIWNARKTKDYDSIYYWLHTIEAFGGDSPIILVMSKMNEFDDDLNLKDLKSKFPQIVGYIKVDSKDGKGTQSLNEKIREVAWSLTLMRTPWIDSWYKVREKLEGLGKNWISDGEFHKICISQGLDDENIHVLDGYLHELGVTLHFKDRLTLKNIVILKPEWATNAFYNILSTKSVLDREGVLLLCELSQIWDTKTYTPSIYYQLMELMNKFELSYELSDKNSYLVPELLPVNAPDTKWNEKDNLCFYYCYDYFLPPGIITRLIVRMHQDLEIKGNGLPLCWRGGALLKLYDSRARVEMKPDEKQIEIRVKGGNEREALGMIRYHLDHINASLKKINITKKIPCNCSNNCSERFSYETLLRAEMNNVETIQCHNSFINIQISSLLDGYKSREERFGKLLEYDVFICHSYKDKPIIEELINRLRKEKITYWFDDEQIDYGDPITQKIEEGLKKSTYIIPCLSKNLNTSGWTRAEYGAILNEEFRGRSKRIVIPLKLDNCEYDDIPILLRDKKRVTYSDNTDFNKFIKSLKNKK